MSSEEQQEYKGKNPEGKGLLKRLETSGILNHHEAKDVSFGHVDNFKLYILVYFLLLLSKSYSEKRVKCSLFYIVMASSVKRGP